MTPTTLLLAAIALTGTASRYHPSLAGREMTNGQPYRPARLTLACRHYRLGDRLRVTNLRTGRSVVARLTDRGPWVRGRIVDLSSAAAERIGLTRAIGVTKVRVEKIKCSD